MITKYQILLRFEIEIESLGESVQFDLARGEESVCCWSCWDTRWQRSGGGEGSSSQETSQVTIKKILTLMRWIMWVNKWRLRNGVIIVLIVILFRFS